MKRSSPPRRAVRELSFSTHQRLNMYALAAGAAGAGVLALAPPAEAKIIYTPAHISILGPRGSYQLDLNHDGVTDFTIANTTNYNTDQAFSNLFAKGPNGNGVVGTFVYRGFPPVAHAFNAGSQIGAFDHFFQGEAKLVSYYSGGGGMSAHGNWVNVSDRYLGVKFKIDGTNHYGWVRFTVKVLKQGLRIRAELTGYAYETDVDKPIVAGATSRADVEEVPEAIVAPDAKFGEERPALGLLALGSPGLAIWRREEGRD
jgi:hypothetical protein